MATIPGIELNAKKTVSKAHPRLPQKLDCRNPLHRKYFPVSNKNKKIPIASDKKIHQKIFVEAKKHKIYLRTLGNIIMLVPPLAISTNELDFLLDGTVDIIKKITKDI